MFSGPTTRKKNITIDRVVRFTDNGVDRVVGRTAKTSPLVQSLEALLVKSAAKTE